MDYIDYTDKKFFFNIGKFVNYLRKEIEASPLFYAVPNLHPENNRIEITPP